MKLKYNRVKIHLHKVDTSETYTGGMWHGDGTGPYTECSKVN